MPFQCHRFDAATNASLRAAKAFAALSRFLILSFEYLIDIYRILNGRFIMKSLTVFELMVPLSEYATVSEDSTLFEAVLALEKAQDEFDKTRYRHRAVLVFDK